MSAPPLPLVDLKRMHAPIAHELADAFARVLSRGNFLLGPETEAFEAEFARRHGMAEAVCCGSGSDALFLALRALGVGPGDAVVTVANSFVATPESIARTGADVVFCDADPGSRNLDPEDLAAVLTEPGAERIRVVLPIHLYGRPANVRAIRAILASAGREDVAIVVDAAQAHGSPDIALHGETACFSFYPGKNLGALGDGGCVLTDKSRLADRMRSLRNHGRQGKHSVDAVGLNSRFDEIQASALRIKLGHLDRWTAERRAAADAYREALGGHAASLRLPIDVPGHVYHLFVVELALGAGSTVRDRLFATLRDTHGIAAGLHYPVPCHRMPPYPTARALPVTDRLADTVLSLPLFPGITEAEIDRVCGAVEMSLGLRAPGASHHPRRGAAP